MKSRILLACVSTLAFYASIAVPRVSVGEFEVTKSTIDSGGSTSSGGDFSITGTVGQFDASPSYPIGGTFSVGAGFWANALNAIFTDGFETE